MHDRERGLSLVWVAVLAGLLALAAMAALFSMRYERNLFAEAWGKVAGGGAARQAIGAAREAAGAGPAKAVLRKCVVAGRTVVSDTDCTDANKTSTVVGNHDTRGVEAPPKKAQPEQASSTSDPMLDKIIEKQTR
jgi:hypothetical protein